MKNFFNMDTPIWQWLTRASTAIWMNMLWLICCIPVVTIGASTTALHRMLFNIHEDKPVSARNFFLAFRDNFKQATALWLLTLTIGVVVLVLAWGIWAVTSNVVRLGLVLLFLAGLFVFSLVFLYSAPLTAYFYNSISGTFVNTLAMGIRHYHQTIPAIVLALSPWALAALSPYLFFRWFPLVITLGTTGIHYGIVLLMEKVFENYTET